MAGRKRVDRRKFAITTLAAGAAGVAFPGVLGAAVGGPEPGPSSKTPAAAPAAAPAPGGWREGTTIPAYYYLDPARYQMDERFLAENFWLMVDHESRIPAPGDYFVFEFGRGDSVILVRGDDRTIRAFHNVCRHRGSRLCRDSEDPRPGDTRLSVRQLGGSGNTPVFRCPYHGWTYDLNGRLVLTYHMPEDFDPAKSGLVPCHVRLAEGHIFVNLSRREEPPEFETDLEWFRQVAKQYGFAGLKVGARRSYTIRANWKLAIENFLECYHCGPVHRNLVTTHNWDYSLPDEERVEKNREVADWIDRAARHAAAVGRGAGMGGANDPKAYEGELNPGFLTGSLDGRPVAPLLPGIKDWTHTTLLATTAWSTGYWQAYDDHVAVARFTPRDVARTDCEILWLVNPRAVEGKDFDPDRLTALWDITIREDIWIVENNQLGLASGAYGPGRYAGREKYPADFIKWYMEKVVRS